MAMAVLLFAGVAACAGAQPKTVVKPLDRLFKGCRMNKGAYVAGTVILAQTHQRESGQGILPGCPQQQVALIISQLDIVVRAVFFDEFLLKNQCLLVIAYLVIIKIFYCSNQGAGLAVLECGARRRKIVAQAALQIFGFTHINNAAPVAFHQVYAGAMRALAPFLFQVHLGHALIITPLPPNFEIRNMTYRSTRYEVRNTKYEVRSCRMPDKWLCFNFIFRNSYFLLQNRASSIRQCYPCRGMQLLSAIPYRGAYSAHSASLPLLRQI